MRNSFSKIIFSLKTKILNSSLEDLHQKSIAELNSDDISLLNFKKRQTLFNHAKEHSIFYKKKYSNLDFFETGIKAPNDFLKIPPLTREELRSNFDNIKVDNVKSNNCEKVSTSGSTGPPVSVLHDKRHPETPIRWRILQWWDIEPWENQAYIFRFKKTFWERFKNHLLWWPTQRIFLAAANPSTSDLKKFVRQLNSTKPSFVQGFVDVVYEFALYLLDNDITIPPPKVVWVTSAPLFSEQRELIEKAFGAPVCDQYGSTEIRLIAAECPSQKGLHIMQDTVHIEFVDANNQPVPPNTSGKILLTDLTNYAFPLIRYEIGDEGKYLDALCDCGKPLYLMDQVRGRQALVIKTPSGLTIKGEHVMAMFDGYMKHFKAIQLKQLKDYSVCVYFIPRDHKTALKSILAMKVALARRTRNEIKISYQETKETKQVGMKTPLIISELK
jgi:phenylacetate-CoA ligase